MWISRVREYASFSGASLAEILSTSDSHDAQLVGCVCKAASTHNVPAARLPEEERTAQFEHWPPPARRVFQQRIFQLHVAAAHTNLMTVV